MRTRDEIEKSVRFKGTRSYIKRLLEVQLDNRDLLVEIERRVTSLDVGGGSVEAILLDLRERLPILKEKE